MKSQKLCEIMDKFKEPYILNKYDKKNNVIIKKLVSGLKEKKQILEKLLNKENKKFNTKFDIEFILDAILNKYNNFKQENNKKFGVGNIVAITNGDAYLQIDLIIKAIISNNRILFINSPVLFNFNLYVVSIIQEILKDENLGEDLISMAYPLEYKKTLIENQKNIDCIIVNKEYEEYSYFKKNVDLKVIYLDYGNINVYIDSDKFDSQIKKIVEEASEREMEVYRYDIENIDEFFQKENNNFIFNTAVIFSDDIKKCMRLYEALKAKNIFINEFDINKIEIELDLSQIQFEKNLFIEK